MSSISRKAHTLKLQMPMLSLKLLKLSMLRLKKLKSILVKNSTLMLSESVPCLLVAQLLPNQLSLVVSLLKKSLNAPENTPLSSNGFIMISLSL
jgi:hypothetical protein